MPRSSAQSDFAVVRLPDPAAVVELPPAARPVSLPRAVLRSDEAGAVATRWVMRATVVLLIVFALLCLIGPHIPSGE